MTSSSGASTTQPQGAQPQGVQPPAIRQWVTPALLLSLLALLVLVSFSLLTDLRSSQAEMRADFRNSRAELLAQMQSSQAELRADLREFKQDVQTAIGGVNTRMDGLSAEMKAGQKELNARMDAS